VIRTQTLDQIDSVDGQICDVPLSILLTARIHTPFTATMNATQTSLLKCLQPFSSLLWSRPRKHTPLTHMMRKGIALRILNVGIRWE